MLLPDRAGAGIVVGALAVMAAGCGDKERPPVFQNPGADAGEILGGGTAVDAGPRCTASGVQCDGQTPYRCGPSGERQYEPSCSGERPFCAGGVGCLGCLPESVRCSPSDANAPQRCSADGARWVDQPACDVAAGQRCSDGRCGDPCAVPEGVRPYLGCEYWATQTPNSQLDPAFPFAVVVGNPQSFPVTVRVRGGALADPMEVPLAPGEVRAVSLPWVRALVQLSLANPGCSDTAPEACVAPPPARSALVRSGAYHVTATAPVAAYQFNPLTFERRDASGQRFQSFTNDASLLLSQRALTPRYVVLTMPHWLPAGAAGAVVLGGFVAVTAVTGETTTVTVRLPTRHGVGVEGTEVRQENLTPGDVLLVVGNGVGDLSGAVVEASAPVAVFAGHDCTNVPAGRVACDHLEEQVFPVDTLGREYVVAALRDRPVESLVRVVSPYDDVVVRFDPDALHRPVRLANREVLTLSARSSFRLSASRPVLVAQFMEGQGTSGAPAGDPAMVYEVPAQQFRDRYDFLVPDTYTRNFVGLVVPHGASALLDDRPLGGEVEQLGSWDIVHAPVAPGRHRLRTVEGVPLGVKVYGVAQYTSYMYPGGLDLRLLPPG